VEQYFSELVLSYLLVFLNGAILVRVGALISFGFLNEAILVRVGALISFGFFK
jgi:hypothetical protein